MRPAFFLLMAAWISAAAGGLQAQSSVSSLAASPSTIRFAATDPDLGAVAGTPATVVWVVSGGFHQRTWSISVAADRSTLNGCPTVPVSAIRVACSSADVSGGAGTGVCAPAFSLSQVPQVLAQGNQGNNTRTYTVGVNFSFTDSWRYIASNGPSCSLTLTYTIVAP